MTALNIVFKVMAETHDGGTGVLRQFATREEAESHPVKLALWKRVWVEKVDLSPKPGASLRRPWSIEEPDGSRFTYLRDADGDRIATLYGRSEQRIRMVAILAEAGVVAVSAEEVAA